jgi:ubiquitin carboxyl-terminal hydrolase 4/11/15
MTIRILQNANAYLLFYRRRTSLPLGGKTFEKIEEARRKPTKTDPSPEPIVIDARLPTPPNENSYMVDEMSNLAVVVGRSVEASKPSGVDDWPTPRSNLSNVGSPESSPPLLEEIELSNFDESQYEDSTSLDPYMISSQQFNFPDPSSKASPTSSDEVEPDIDLDSVSPTQHRTSFPVSPTWSRRGSNASDVNPFSNSNLQKDDNHID